MALGKPLIPKMTAETTGVCKITATSTYNSNFPWHVGSQVDTEYWDSYPSKTPVLTIYFNTGWYNTRTIVITRRAYDKADTVKLTVRHRTDGSTVNDTFYFTLPLNQMVVTYELPRILNADTFTFSVTTDRLDVQFNHLQLYAPPIDFTVLKINNQYYKPQGSELVTINNFDESKSAFETQGVPFKNITPSIISAASKIGDFKILTMKGDW